MLRRGNRIEHTCAHVRRGRVFRASVEIAVEGDREVPEPRLD